MTLAPLVPAEPDESVSARVAAICRPGWFVGVDWGQQDRSCVVVARVNGDGSWEIKDDVPTKVEVPR